MAENQIKADELIENDVFKPTRESATATIPALREMIGLLNQMLLLTKETVKNNGLGSGEEIEKIAKAHTQVNAAMNAKINLENQLLKKEEELKAGMGETGAELARVKAAIEAQNRAQKESVKTSNLQEGSLDQLRAKLREATKAFDAMGRAMREGLDGKAALVNLTKLRVEVGALEQASGRFQRNVGDYKSSYNGLAHSINQLTREAPAAAISMNTFFLAISNNIPMLVDEINKIKTANVELANSGKPTVSVLGSIAKAFLSWQTVISVGITLLTLYGGKIIDFITGTKSAGEAQKSFNDYLKESSKVVQDFSDKIDDASLKLKILTGEISKQMGDELNIQKQFLTNKNEANRKYYEELAKLKKEFGVTDSEGYIIDEVAVFGESDEFHKKFMTLKRQRDMEVIKAEQLRNENLKLIQEQEHRDFLKRVDTREKEAGKKVKEVKDTSFEDAQRQIIEDDEWNRAHDEQIAKEREEWNKIQHQLAVAREKEEADEVKRLQAIADKMQKDREAAETTRLKKVKDDRIQREKDLYNALDRMQDERFSNAEKQIDRTIANSQREQDTLRLLAAQGVDNAEASLAAEQKVQAEAEAKRAELLRKKQRSEFALTVLKLETANLEANPDNPGKATLDTLAQAAALITIIEGLPSFFEGTEDTGNGGGLDGKGGFLAINHPHERIIPAEQNALFGGVPNGEAAKVMSLYNSNQLAPVVYGSDTREIVRELREVRATIKSEKSDTYFDYDRISESFIRVTESRTQLKIERTKNGGIW